jgi:hypothetical protein
VDLSLITVGSSLNISNENVPHHPMWDQPLDPRIRWIDLWARYDWVPHGPPSKSLISKVRGGAGEFVPIRVVNLDSPLGDHSAYFGNHEEVVSRPVYEIANRPSAGS